VVDPASANSKAKVSLNAFWCKGRTSVSAMFFVQDAFTKTPFKGYLLEQGNKLITTIMSHVHNII